MSGKELRIGRRAAVTVLIYGGVALTCTLLAHIEPQLEKPEEQFVYYGVTKKLTYFTFSQQVPGIFVVIIEPKIEEHLKNLGVPLPNPSTLTVSLLDTEKYPVNDEGPMSSQGALEVKPEEVNISREHLLGNGEAQEEPPDFFVSWFASMTLFEGLCLSAVRRGELSLEASREKVDDYNKKLFESLAGDNPEYIMAVLYDENKPLPTPPPNAPSM